MLGRGRARKQKLEAGSAEHKALELVRQHQLTGDPELLSASLILWEEAVRCTSPADRQDLARRLASMAETLRLRFQAQGDPDDLDEAVRRGREAVEVADLTVAGASDLVRSLAHIHLVAYEHSKDPEQLRLAQETTQHAFDVAVPKSPAQLDLSSDLVELLGRRFQATRDPLFLEEAVQLADLGTHRATGNRPWDVRALQNAAVVHGMRFALYDDAEDLLQQVGMARSALAKLPADDPARIGPLILLSAALRREASEAETSAELEVLAEAISVGEQAVRMARLSTDSADSRGRPGRRLAEQQLAQALDTLGNAMAKRAVVDWSEHAGSDGGADLDAAVALSSEARELAEVSSQTWLDASDNLGQNLLDRYRSGTTAEDLTTAERVWREVLSHGGALPPTSLSGLADIVRHRVGLSGLTGDSRRDRLEEAAQIYARARDLLETHLEEVPVTQRLARERRRQDLVRRQAGVLLELGRTGEALVVAEHGKAGLLAAALRRLPVEAVDGVPEELLERERGILAEIDGQESMQLLADTTPQVSVLVDGMAIRISDGPVLVPAQKSRRAKLSLRRGQQQALQEVWKQIEASGDAGRRHVELRRGAPLDWPALRNALRQYGAGAAVLALTAATRSSATPGQVDGAEDVAVLALGGTDDEPIVVWTGLDEGLATHIADQLRSEVAEHDPAAPRLQTWHRRLIRPLSDVAAQLGRPPRLLVSSTTVLPSLPWPVLLAEAGWQDPSTPYAVTTAPSLTILANAAPRQRPADVPVRVIGDPDGTLPHSRDEAEQVAGIWRTEPVTGPRATGAELTRALQQADMVHVACHAHFDEDNPLSSGLQLADGVLKAHEMLDAQTDVQVLVLSACDTGRVKGLPGDQAVGFGTVLLRCGVRSLVVSSWEVQDEATSVLMRTFHEAVRGGARLDDALGAASAAVASHERWSHPYYWSGFSLVGDPSPLVADGIRAAAASSPVQ